MNKPTSTPTGRSPIHQLVLLLMTMAWTSVTVLAQDTGTLAGKVYDSEHGDYLVGARVQVKGTNLVTTTDNAGEYRLNQVPVGEQTVVVSYLGSSEASSRVSVMGGKTVPLNVEMKSDILILKEFKVTSYAGQQVRAMNQQRQSDRISNIISADSIGALPDDNLRMALNRLPGINVAGGDNGSVSIRGMEGKLNAVVLDGNPISSAATNMGGFGNQGSTRGIDLANIPAEAIQGIEVIKTPTADMDGDSIGGRVDLKTASALDYRRRILNISAEARTYEFGGSGYSSGLTYGDVLNADETMGLFLNVNWKNYSREFGQQNYSYANPEDAFTGGTPIFNELNPNKQYEEVKELTTNGTFDWKVSSTTRLTFKGWLTSSDKLDQRPRIQLFIRDITASQLTDSNGLTAEGNSRIRERKRNRFRPDRELDQYRFGMQSETILANSVVNLGLLYGNSTFTGSEYDYRFEANSSSIPYKLDRKISLPFPSITFNAGAVDLYNNISLYSPQETSYKTRNNSDKDLTLNADWTVDLGTAMPAKIKAGFKGRFKSRVNGNFVRIYTPTTLVTVAAIGKTDPFSTYDRYQELGFTVNDPAFVQFFQATRNNPAYYVERLAASQREEAEAQQDIDEDILSGYVMGTVDVSSKFRLVGGLRYERTEGTYNWAASRSNRGTQVFPDVVKKTSYNTPVPSFLATYRFREKDVLRFGWSKTLARPDWNTLVPVDQSISLAVADPTNLTNSTTIPVTIRNPNLDPQQSNNLDLAFEHYYGPSNLLSFGVFYKKLDNYIGSPITRRSSIQATNPLTGDPLLTSGGLPIFFSIRRQENGIREVIKGFEFVWQHRFLRLPGLLSGLGIDANFTYIKGVRDAPLFLNPADTLQVTGYKHFDQVEAQPEKIVHAQLFWERRGISARLGYVYTAAQIDEFDKDGQSDYFRAAYSSLDLSLSYEFHNGLKFYVEGNNLTSEPVDSRYYENRNWLATYDQDGTRWSFGIKKSF